MDRVGKLRADGIDEHMNIFLDVHCTGYTKDEVIKAGIAVFQYNCSL